MLEIHVAFHDITPIHLEFISTGLNVLKNCGVEKLTCLWVPNFHEKCKAANAGNELAELFNDFSFQYEWILHGYTHLDSGLAQEQNTKKEEWQRKHLTGNEGEFLSIGKEEAQERIKLGLSEFKSYFNKSPEGFVAPAWLYRKTELPEILKNEDFSWTENHNEIVDLKNNRCIAAPVISWVTRSFVLQQGALFVCPILALKHSKAPLLRIAVHPRDFAFSSTTKSIERLLGKVLKRREQILIGEKVVYYNKC
jgi:predicted deacetylase